MNKHNVFVYGSLKDGFHNNDIIAENPNNKLIGNCYTKKKYLMISLGSFPAVIDWYTVDHNNHVTGELYSVDDTTLHQLDMLEGHPLFYKRKSTQVVMDSDGSVVDTYIYFLNRKNMTVEEVDRINSVLCDTESDKYFWKKP